MKDFFKLFLGKATSPQKEHPGNQNMKFPHFFLFLWIFLQSLILRHNLIHIQFRIWIQISARNTFNSREIRRYPISLSGE